MISTPNTFFLVLVLSCCRTEKWNFPSRLPVQWLCPSVTHWLGPCWIRHPARQRPSLCCWDFSGQGSDPVCWPLHLSRCARLGGLGNGLLTQEGNQQRGAAGSNQGRKVRPTVAATKGPKDELTAQPKSGSCPTGGNPCVGMLDSSESNAQAYHSLLRQLVQPVALCVWRYTCTRVHMYICTHNVWCFSRLYLNYILK